MKINFKIILVGLGPLLLFIYFVCFYVEKDEAILKNEKYSEEAELIQNKVKFLIKEKQEVVNVISTSLSVNENIKKILLSKDKNDFKLKAFSQKLRENSSLRNVWFQVISADGVSLYRSWTDKRGDSLVKVRKDIKKMIELQHAISSISVGKYDMSFKSMIPIYNNKKFIGIIETLAKFNSISIKLHESGLNSLILVDKKYKNQLTHAFTKRFIDGYYVANLNADSRLIDMVKKNSVQEYIKDNKFKVDEKNNLFITIYKLPDVNGNDMAYFIFFKKLDSIDISKIEHENKIIIFVFILISLSIGAMLYYFYIINYKNFIEKQNKILKYQAEHDTLTKLPNRLLFLDRLEQSLKHARRRKQTVSVLFLDLDRFKEVNDTYGHEAGDKLLKHVAARLKDSVREEDTVARLGGDEFTVILQNLQQREVIKVVDKIMRYMQDAFYINGIELFTTFSIGISSYPDDGDTSEILLRNADSAMYKAKDSGKNNYQFYNED